MMANIIMIKNCFMANLLAFSHENVPQRLGTFFNGSILVRKLPDEAVRAVECVSRINQESSL